MSELHGEINERYYVIEEVGHGGLTTVYKALDVQEKREVALKVLAPSLVLDPGFKIRFEREIKILEAFDHPNIVPILDSGEHDGVPFLIMPFFENGTLTDRLRVKPLTPEECGILINDICSALAYEHKRGVVHRDIKPSNILLDEDGKAFLSDFDLVYLPEASQNLTGSAVIGTPAYMSPEQCNGGPVDARSDQYSLAVVLFQLSTGHLPFYAESPIALAVQQINEPLPRPRDLNPDLPEPIEAVLIKALSKEPEQRYSSIIAFNQAFQKALRIAMITGQGEGGWTAKYYEITQVLSRIQIRARGWFAQPIFTRRYALIGLFLLLIISSGILYSLFRFAKDTSDTRLRATIAAVYTSSFSQAGMSQGPEFVETVVAGTLHAMDIEAVSIAELETPIPVTGGESTATEDPFGAMNPGISATPGEDELEPSSSPGVEGQETPDPTTSGNPSPTFSATSTSTPVPTGESSATPSATSSGTPVATSTGTFTPTLTPSPSDTPTETSIPSPTEDVCAGIQLTSFNVLAVNVNYTLVNNSSVTVTLSSINFNWPTNNRRLNQILVSGNTVWDEGDDTSPTFVDGLGSSVNSGSSSQLRFVFKRAAASTGYELEVAFWNGCVVLR
jgi:serine/threonine protein kinase